MCYMMCSIICCMAWCMTCFMICYMTCEYDPQGCAILTRRLEPWAWVMPRGIETSRTPRMQCAQRFPCYVVSETGCTRPGVETGVGKMLYVQQCMFESCSFSATIYPTVLALVIIGNIDRELLVILDSQTEVICSACSGYASSVSSALQVTCSSSMYMQAAVIPVILYQRLAVQRASMRKLSIH
jgi:hypothetical protein